MKQEKENVRITKVNDYHIIYMSGVICPKHDYKFTDIAECFECQYFHSYITCPGRKKHVTNIRCTFPIAAKELPGPVVLKKMNAEK